MAGAVVGTGHLETSQNPIVVQHFEGGIIKQVHVSDGDLVEAGQALISLDTTNLDTELSILLSRHNEIAARSAHARARRDEIDQIKFPEWLLLDASNDQVVAETLNSHRNLHAATRDARLRDLNQLHIRRDQTRAQLAVIETQVLALEHQKDLLHAEIDQQSRLHEEGLVPLQRLFALRRETAAVEVKISELANLKIELLGRETDINLQIRSIPSEDLRDATVQLRDLHIAQTEISMRIQAIETQLDAMTVRAPIAGRLNDMTAVAERTVLRAIDPIAVIIPQEQDLRVKAHIQPADISEVSEGQSVFIRLPGLKTMQHEDISGRVTQISADTLNTPSTGEPYYLVRVELHPFDQNEFGDDTLRPGMEVEVFFRTRDRTPLSYLVAPLTRYFGRAMRES